MKYEDLPHRWKAKLSEYLTNQHGITRDHLYLNDFVNQSTKLVFEDGSSALFRYTLLLEVPEFGEVAVFTEHCGYHIFSISSIDTTNHNYEF